jgi:ubiquinone/menaquinone biosynthesis C-methylase UbiE
MEHLKSQFGHPRGVVGWVVGHVLAIENRERIAWAIQQLDIQPADRVLEIGYGPGLGIEQAALHAAHVAGLDVSEVMLSQARRRNAAGVDAGKIDLRQGDVRQLPFADHNFDKVFAINSYHIWPDGHAGLVEIQRVLKPDGAIGIIEQPPETITEAVVMQQRGDAIEKALTQAGFQQIELKCANLKRGWTVCALATL